ncbi:MAG: lysophospholipid acyltransferase family protein [Candidatus Omnitrophica bacterium]|nr:lysophospholipid acyltransferase family protein [Candidatus Omnitrophota bacterium]
MSVVYYGYVAVDKISRLLPKKAVGNAAYFFGKLYARFFSKDIGAIEENLKAVLPDGNARRASRELVASFAVYLADLFYSHRFSADFVRKNVTVRGRQYLDESLAGGKGVLLVSAHLGNWELGGAALAKLGYPLHGIALKHADPRIEALFEQRRREHGLRVIPYGSSLHECYRVLKRNGIVALNGDRLFHGEGIPVRFLGRQVFFPKGLSKLSLATGAAVVPAFFIKSGQDRYELDIQSPIAPAEPEAMTQEFAGRVEAQVRRHPLQWFIFQKFWDAPKWPE